MSRLRKNRNQPSVSLFPFLAVLICTLGVLIVMLVLAVKSAEVAKEAEQATQDQTIADQTEAAKQRLALEKFRSESIQNARSDVLTRLAESRENRSYLLQDVADATKQLNAAKQQIQSLKQSIVDADKANLPATTPAETKSKQAAIDKLKQQVTTAKQNLDTLRKKSKDQGPTRFSLVPHQGSGGTFRRPIFLECLENQIRLQPSGITLHKQDFALPISAGNPLDVALLTIQEHWQQHDVAGKHGSPYPLIVVRPDGAETFVLARRAMKSWTDEFGYELVDADKQIDFGAPDDVLVSKLNEVIQHSLDRQTRLAQQRYELERHLSQFSSNRNASSFSVSKPGSSSVTTSAYQASSGNGRSATGFNSNTTAARYREFGSGAQQVSYLANRTRAEQNAGNTNNQTGSTLANRNQKSANNDFHNNNNDFRQRHQSNNNGPTSSSRSASNNQSTSNGSSAAGNLAGPNSKQSGSQSGSSQQPGSSANSSTPNLANRRGQGWALPSRPQGGTGYLRPITVVCSANHLLIKTATGTERSINFESGAVAAIDVLVEEIWNRIDSWGIAGKGSYWKPQLRIKIIPGGEQRFTMLQNMLQNSGLVVDQEANQ